MDTILYDIIHGRIVSLWSLEGIDGAFCSKFYRDTNKKYKHETHSYQISLKSGDKKCTLHFRNHNCSFSQTSRISIQLVCDISHSIKINLHIIKQHVSISGKNIYHSIPLLCYWSVILITTIRFKFYAKCRNFPPLFRVYHYQHLGKVKHTH
jgi:hypothetical protein